MRWRTVMRMSNPETPDFIETSRLARENSRSIVWRFDRNQLMIEAWIERAVSLTIAFDIWSHQSDDKTSREEDDGNLSIRRSIGKRRACSSRKVERWHADWKSASVGRHRRRQPVAQDRTRFHLEDSGCPASAATVGPVLDSASQELINRTGEHSSARLLINARERVFIEDCGASDWSRLLLIKGASFWKSLLSIAGLQDMSSSWNWKLINWWLNTFLSNKNSY